MKEIVLKMKEIYQDKLLYIGMRGSHCLGLNTEDSDEDYLVVISDDLENKFDQGQDIQISTLSQFHKCFLQGDLQVVEALTYKLYSSDEFNYEKYLQILQTDIYEELFRCNIFKVIKNHIKRYNKNIQKDKMIAKILLFEYLLQLDKNRLIECYLTHSIETKEKRQYLRIRQGKKTQEHIFRIAEISNIRNDKTFKEQVYGRMEYLTKQVEILL